MHDILYLSYRAIVFVIWNICFILPGLLIVSRETFTKLIFIRYITEGWLKEYKQNYLGFSFYIHYYTRVFILFEDLLLLYTDELRWSEYGWVLFDVLKPKRLFCHISVPSKVVFVLFTAAHCLFCVFTRTLSLELK